MKLAWRAHIVVGDVETEVVVELELLVGRRVVECHSAACQH